MKRLFKLVIFGVLLLNLCLAQINLAEARSGYGGYRSSGYRSGGYHTKTYIPKSSYRKYNSTTINTSRSAPGVKRNKEGRIERSSKAKNEFMKETGYPHGRPGYVVDHIVPLKRGGADTPNNMQWQTKEAAKTKDKVE